MLKESDSNIKARVSNLRRINSKIRYGLVIQSIRNQLARIGIEITPYYWVQEGLYTEIIPQPQGALSDYSLFTLDGEGIQSIIHNIRGYTLEDFLHRQEEGQLCYGMKYKDEIAAIMWANLKECVFRPGNSKLGKDEAYLHSMYTLESFRGYNIAPYLRYKCYEALNMMGRDKLYSITEYFNKSAIKYKQKLQAKNLDLYLIINLFGKFRWFFHLKSYGNQTIVN